MKFAHPLFESAIISINVLNMIDVVYNALACSDIDWAMDNIYLPGKIC